MFISYQFIDNDQEIVNTLYLTVESIEINTSLHSAVINMSCEYTAYLYDDDVVEFLTAVNEGKPVFDFNSLSDDTEFFNKYGDALVRYKGVIP